MTKELDRIVEAYKNRDAAGKGELYTFFQPSTIYIAQQRERELIKTLIQHSATSLSEMRILDLGCGTGNVLRDFIKYGAKPKNCYGIDLLPDRIKIAKDLSPNVSFECGNAENLPYEDEFFDIVLCFTVFTSILDPEMKRGIVSEMYRVLKRGGIILYYDYHINNPKNLDVRGVKKREIRKLFQGFKIQLKRVTLAPPLVRAIAPFSFMLCQILEKVPLLRTHYLGVMTKL
ncbi:MAG: class I SAM-dependent methyltransferase [Firmicutes bacterium]|nr:class I SAM-dependent methyltransferase [Bacillota bacterium]